MIITALLIGTLQVTSYQPIPAQTRPECLDRFHCDTAIGDGITKFGVAVSRDLLKSGQVHYGDVHYIEGYGYKVVNDLMGPKAKNAVDMMVFTRAQEKEVGVRHLKVYVIH